MRDARSGYCDGVLVTWKNAQKSRWGVLDKTRLCVSLFVTRVQRYCNIKPREQNWTLRGVQLLAIPDAIPRAAPPLLHRLRRYSYSSPFAFYSDRYSC